MDDHETPLGLIGLWIVVKGAATLADGWRLTGRLDPIRKAIGPRKLTCVRLYGELRGLEPGFIANIDRKKHPVTRMALLATSMRILEDAEFTTLAGPASAWSSAQSAVP